MSIQSLGAAASGIAAMQTELDTIGNNIANSETTGYTTQNAQFADLLNQQLQPAGGPVGNTLASTNPSSIGSGVAVASITNDFSEGSIQQTGVNSDIAVVGNGFLIVNQTGNTYYTRDGNLQIDANGHLATSSGGLVQGWGPGQPTSSPPTPVSIVVGSNGGPAQTQNVVLGGNLPSNPIGPVTVTATMYDSLGNQVPVTLTFTPTVNSNGTATSWSLQGTVPGASANLWNTAPTLVFNSSGQLSTINGTAVGTGQTSLPINNEPSNYTWTGTTNPSFDFPAVGSQQAVTQFAGSETLAVSSQDGHSAGTLESYSIGSNGVITGVYSNGDSAVLGTIAIAQFANAQGLQDIGNTYFGSTVASGVAQLGQPGSSGFSTIRSGALEGSNVNLASQLTKLIEAQTAYQANTKVVTTTATAVQSLMNMP